MATIFLSPADFCRLHCFWSSRRVLLTPKRRTTDNSLDFLRWFSMVLTVLCLCNFGFAQAEVGPENTKHRPLVILDPGHGGHDPGAISIRTRLEKDITLQIALEIRDRLIDSGNVRVLLTRSDDRYVSLFGRRQYARRQRADLFLSIHADISSNSSASGATIYTLSDLEARNVAERMNARREKNDLIGGANLDGTSDDQSIIIVTLIQGLTLRAASTFVDLLQQNLRGVEAASPSHRFAAFAVLKAPDMPSALLETGYLSNSGDEQRLASRAGRKKIAGQVANAIETYFGRRQSVPASSEPAPPFKRPRLSTTKHPLLSLDFTSKDLLSE